MAQSLSPSPLTSFVRWLRLKNYQYEVTFSLYMLTPTEKLIFNTLVFVLVSMLCTAAYVYLPNHVLTICNRIWYYLDGNDPYPFTSSVVGAAKDFAARSSQVAVEGAAGGTALGGWLNTVHETVVDSTKNVANAGTTGLSEL